MVEMETESMNFKDMAEPGAVVSGSGGNIQNYGNEREHNQETSNKHPAPRLVERRAGLRGLSSAPSRVAPASIRKRTEHDLRETDAGIPCHKTEKAIRELVCSLMERQDRMTEEPIREITDLNYRIEDREEGRKR
jgi:hypothetical protein